MANQWFKFWGGEYLSDPKMDAFDGNERSIWLTILCLSSQSNDGWIKYSDEKKIIEKANVKEEDRTKYFGILQKLLNFGMLQFCNENVTDGFRPKNWEKRQYSEGFSRIKKFREKKSNENVTAKITIEENRIEKNRIEQREQVAIAPVKVKKEIELPDWLDKQLWAKWIAYRKQAKYKTYTEIGLKQLFKELELNKENLAEMINTSIAKGWQGLFPPKKNFQSSQKEIEKPFWREASREYVQDKNDEEDKKRVEEAKAKIREMYAK